MTYAYDNGVLMMNSAGNNGEQDPSRGVFNQPLFVASLTSADVRSSFSNYGREIDISANGSGILSTTTSANGTGVNYEVFDGTSMSTPHAAGVAAPRSGPRTRPGPAIRSRRNFSGRPTAWMPSRGTFPARSGQAA